MSTGLVAGNGGGPPLGVVAALPFLLFVVALLIFVFSVSETLLHFVLSIHLQTLSVRLGDLLWMDTRKLITDLFLIVTHCNYTTSDVVGGVVWLLALV